MIDAQDAYRIGLVNKVVPAAELLAESEKMLRGILAMAPLAVRLCLEAVDQGCEMTLDEGLLLEANHFGLLAATNDMKEGTQRVSGEAAAPVRGSMTPRTGRAARIALLGAVAAAAVVACQTDRDRPGPPRLAHHDRPGLRPSPDTFTGIGAGG